MNSCCKIMWIVKVVFHHVYILLITFCHCYWWNRTVVIFRTVLKAAVLRLCASGELAALWLAADKEPSLLLWDSPKNNNVLLSNITIFGLFVFLRCVSSWTHTRDSFPLGRRQGEAQGTRVFPVLLPSGEADTGEPPVTTVRKKFASLIPETYC